MRTLLASTLLLAVTACSMPTVMTEALTTEFVPQGEVMYRNRGAAFDAVRVRSPNCNITKRTDGSWGGVFDSRAFDVSVTETHIRGVEFMLTREDSRPGHLIITGQFQGRIYRFEITQDEAMLRTPNGSMNFPGRLLSEGNVKYGPMQNLELRGEAGAATPPWPQIAFALMAAFN